MTARAKVNVAADIPPDLHDRMVDHIKESDAYRYKAEFVRDAIRERVERLEQEQAEVPPPEDELR